MNRIGLSRQALGQASPEPEAAFAANAWAPESVPILKHYLAIIRRRKWVIAAAVAIAAAAALVLTMLMTPLFTASSTIEIRREEANIVNVEGVESKTSAQAEEFYQTQYGLLKSRALAERVTSELKLYQDPAFLTAFDIADTPLGVRPVLNQTERETRSRQITDILLKNIKITPVRLSSLVDVSFTSADPQLSAKIVQAWTRLFVEQALERRYDASSYARRFLEQRLAQLAQRLEQSERAVVNYASREGIINLAAQASENPGATSNEQPLVASELMAASAELQRATAERIASQSRLASTSDTSPMAMNNTVLSSLLQRRAEARAQYAQLMVKFEPEFPEAQAVAAQIARFDDAIETEEARVRRALGNEYQMSSRREASLQSRVNGLKSELLNNQARSIQYNIFKREADTNRQLYDALLQRYKEIGVAGGIGVNNIMIVDQAQVPQGPSSPNLLLNLLVGLIAGVVIGAGAAFALEQTDESIGDPAEIEAKLRLPVLGPVPKAIGDVQTELSDRKSALAEAYISIQTSLEFSTDHGVPHSIVVTSTRPAEGKSTTSTALAHSLARTGRRVVLVDGDMRSPSLHELFDLKNDFGLSNYLAGEDDLDMLIVPSGIQNIAIMAAGPLPPNAAELLTSPRVSLLFEALRARSDHVVVDAPPVMGLADAPLLTSRAEGTIFVVESHGTRTNMARVALSRLQTAQARILGCVMTKFESRRAHYGYGYEYGYGYGRDTATERAEPA